MTRNEKLYGYFISFTWYDNDGTKLLKRWNIDERHDVLLLTIKWFKTFILNNYIYTCSYLSI